MTATLSRFCCPACGAALTPWLRELTLTDAVANYASGTWLLPGGTFARSDGPLQLQAPALPDHPWLLAPLDPQWLRPHPDRARSIGCCGMSYRPGLPNLTCPCGQEVGFGYRDCCNPHWYALHACVRREQVDDPEPPPPFDESLTRLRALVAEPLHGLAAWPPNDKHPFTIDLETWKEAPRLRDIGLWCGGGVGTPTLLLRSMRLPPATAMHIPIRWPQLVRSLVLGEQPWGTPEVPLTWQADRFADGSAIPRSTTTVQVSRADAAVLLTLRQDRDTWAVRVSASRWRSAWTRLRRGVTRTEVATL